jgi:hypothetical protein
MGKLFQHRLPFWERVTRCAHPYPCAQCCWPWYGATDAWGYGRTRRVLYGKVETYAHRIVWIETHGRLPRPGCHPAHTCARPACCNPSHLEERTAAEIQQASVRSGWRAQHPHARKLTPARVAQIRQAWQATPRPSQRQLAAEAGVSQSLVHAILHEQIWRVTPDQVAVEPPPDSAATPLAPPPSPAQVALPRRRGAKRPGAPR